MIVKVSPAHLSGAVAAPPSKSLGHRALLCAGLAHGSSRLTGISDSQDMLATLGGLAALGAQAERAADGALLVRGAAFPQALGPRRVCCRESGSTLRFLIPLFALSPEETVFTGSARLLARPQSVYADLFAAQGLPFLQAADCLRVRGPLRGGAWTLRGDVSSQFLTGLLFALPLLDADSVLRILPPFSSKGYVDLTLQMLARFGVHAGFAGEDRLEIPGRQRYAAQDVAVEGDYSQAAFFAAAGAVQGGLRIANLAPDSLQGDRAILEILRACGAGVEWGADGAHISSAPLSAREIDVDPIPDLAPVLSVLALFCAGETRLVNAARLRDKESDRIAAMEQELRRLGARVSSTRDSLTVAGFPAGRAPWAQTEVDCHNDHRVVMSLAIAATLGRAPLILRGAEAVRKSYPNFFADLKSLGGKVEVLEE